MSKLTDLRRKVMEKEFSRMNDKQKEAVFHTEGPLLILAGAGSGKTTVLVNRMANLIRFGKAYHSDWESGLSEEDIPALEAVLEGNPLGEDLQRRMAVDPCRPWQILAITFTNKAAGELKERLISLLGDQGGEIWASTFHSTCARILRQYGEKLGYTSHFTIYDTDDSRRLMKDCQNALKIEDKVLPCKAILSAISRAKDSLISPKDFLESAGRDVRLSTIGKAYEMYQRRLREADAMDFDDLIVSTVQLFRENPDVLEYFQNKFRYIMVDEYQDTNHAQYILIKLLAQKRQNLCVVGDDDQSIYKFRGATIENIMSFEKSFPNASLIRLEQNYRSTQNILDAANAVISNNTERKGKTLWTENGQGEKIILHTALNESDEADQIATKILDGVAKGRKYADYAILYRMNTLSNALEKNFVKSGIPYRIIGGLRFYERREIRDMIAYLSVINNPSDDVRLRRIINVPKRAIGEKTVMQAAAIAEGIGESLFEVLCHADEFEPLRRSAAKLQQFAKMIRECMDVAEEDTLEEVYRMILEKTGYIESLRENTNEDPQDRIDNINELASSLVKYQEENGEDASLSGFLEEVSLMTDIDNYDGSTDAVVMMTMHSAKGLEFPCVFLPGFEDGIFPGVQAIYNPEEIEEERRLAYVAITRAKEELMIINADSRIIFGTTNRNKLSRFAKEIPEELTEKTRSNGWKKAGEDMHFYPSRRDARNASIQAARSFGPTFAAQEKKPMGTYHPGDRVRHKVFGEGLIVGAMPMGSDTLLEIAFEKVGTKKLMANFARLEKIDD